MTLTSTLNPKVVRTIKRFKDINKIVQQTEQEKTVSENSSFLVGIATIAMVVEEKMSIEADQTFN